MTSMRALLDPDGGVITYGKQCRVVRAYRHPNFEQCVGTEWCYDVALLKIDCGQDTINTDIEPISLPDDSDANGYDYLQRTGNIRMRAVGMGTKSLQELDSVYTSKLQEADLFTVPLGECAAKYRDRAVRLFEEKYKCNNYVCENGDIDEYDDSDANGDNYIARVRAIACCKNAKLASLNKDVDTSMMCTLGGGSSDKQPATCSGDSGGPLLWWDARRDKYVVYGVVSFGGCSVDRTMPDVYHYVPSSLEWIRATTGIGRQESSHKTTTTSKQQSPTDNVLRDHNDIYLYVIIIGLVACVFFFIGRQCCRKAPEVNDGRYSTTDIGGLENVTVSVPIIDDDGEKNFYTHNDRRCRPVSGRTGSRLSGRDNSAVEV